MTTMPIYNMTDTWNAIGTTFNSIMMDTSDGASGFPVGAAASQLINLKTNGTQRFGVRSPHFALGTDVTPFLNMVDIWNTSGAAVGIKYNVTDTASAAASLFADFQIASVSKWRVAKTGGMSISAGSSVNDLLSLGGTTTGIISYASNALGLSYQLVGDNTGSGGPAELRFGSTGFIGWNSGTSLGAGSRDLFLTRAAAASLQFGAADAAAPVAQTQQVQSVVAGTASIAGADWTLQQSLSTGTAVGGNVIRKASFAGVTQSAVSVTVTSASPAVVTLAAHGMVPGQPFQFGGSVAPTGTALGVTYYVLASGLTVNTFQFALTLALWVAGTAANTSSTGTSVTLTTGTTVQNPASTIATWGPSGLTGSQTTSLLSLAQTWNTSGNVTGLLFNANNIASGSSSLLMDLQAAGTTKLSVRKDGYITFAIGAYIDPTILANDLVICGGVAARQNVVIRGAYVTSVGTFAFGSAGNFTSAADVYLLRDAAGTLALRNSTTAQTFNIYNTYTDASNYGTLRFGFSGSQGRISVAAAGTAGVDELAFSTYAFSAIKFYLNAFGTNVWTINGSGNFFAGTDNTYDIGASAANRPKNIYVAGYENVGVRTFASLPTAASAGNGSRMYVTDATALVFGTTVASGGSVNGPIYSDGTQWRAG